MSEWIELMEKRGDEEFVEPIEKRLPEQESPDEFEKAPGKEPETISDDEAVAGQQEDAGEPKAEVPRAVEVVPSTAAISTAKSSGVEPVHAEAHAKYEWVAEPPSIVAQGAKAVAGGAAPEQESLEVKQGEAGPVGAVDAASAIDAHHTDNGLTERVPGSEAADAAVLAESRRRTRRSFLGAGVAAAAGFGFYKWLDGEPSDDMQPGLLRRTLQANAALSRGLTHEDALAPTYPLSRAETLRVNGMYGLMTAMVPESYRLQVVGVQGAMRHPRFTKDVTAWEYRYSAAKSTEDPGHDSKTNPDASAQKMAPAGMVDKAEEDENHTGRKPRGMGEAGESDSTLPPGTPGLLLTMDDVLKFPRHELVTQFKCIEGWSQIVHWAGVRLADFMEAYPPERVNGREPKYVYMETPDGDYYTGYDLKACRHPQALLVTEMMGAPLTQFHGAPLRLHMPSKYGYKQIKRIALVSYTDEKPDDYWTKLGYDWYAGL